MLPGDEKRQMPPEVTSWLRKNRRNPQAQQAIDEILAEIQAAGQASPIEQRVAHLMRTARHTQHINAQYISKQLGMCESKLYRLLKKAGTNFHTLWDAELRHRIERKVASNPDIHIKQLSSYMGYSNRNSFCRAFQRLFNECPSVWLKQRKEQLRAKRDATDHQDPPQP